VESVFWAAWHCVAQHFQNNPWETDSFNALYDLKSVPKIPTRVTETLLFGLPEQRRNRQKEKQTNRPGQSEPGRARPTRPDRERSGLAGFPGPGQPAKARLGQAGSGRNGRASHRAGSSPSLTLQPHHNNVISVPKAFTGAHSEAQTEAPQQVD
jgi:hypothetical protein